MHGDARKAPPANPPIWHRIAPRVHYTAVGYFRLTPRHQKHNGVSVTPTRFWSTAPRASAGKTGRRATESDEWNTARVWQAAAGAACVSQRAASTALATGQFVMSADIAVRSGMRQPYCVGKMHENGRKRATCGTTALGIHLRGRSGDAERSRPRSRVRRRACTMAFGLHARGHLDAPSDPVCAPGRDSRAGHQQHNGRSVTPIRGPADRPNDTPTGRRAALRPAAGNRGVRKGSLSEAEAVGARPLLHVHGLLGRVGEILPGFVEGPDGAYLRIQP